MSQVSGEGFTLADHLSPISQTVSLFIPKV